MSSVSAVNATKLLGAQRPSTLWLPPSVRSWGDEAIELCELAGLGLDPWQQFILATSLGERDDGKWAAFEVGVDVARQNGKGGLLEGRELTGLFILGERLITHSAHQYDTSMEAFRRLLMLIEDTPDLDQLVQRVVRSHGEEGIELKSGQRIRFRTRTKGGGRGFTGDLLVLDEAMDLPEATLGALLPTLSARPNPQVWYAGSAVDQDIHEHGIVFARVRARGRAGGDQSLAWYEFAAGDSLDDLDGVIDDPDAWARANPALGIRITLEQIARERASMDPRTFAVERLGIGDWPNLKRGDYATISQEAWEAAEDGDSAAVDPVRFAIDVRPDRSKSAIAAAGMRSDGHRHFEVVDHKTGTDWVPGRLLELTERHLSEPVILDEKSPAAALLPKLLKLGVRVETIGGAEYAQACGAFVDAINDRDAHHLGTSSLTAAVRGAAQRPLGDSWAWSRKNSAVDICPLVACTLALWGVVEDVDDLVLSFSPDELAEEPGDA
jgi:hypothetical protein